MKFPAYRVVSANGFAPGTKIINVETGEPLKNVQSIVLRAEPNDLWRAEVHLVGVAVDVTVLGSAFRHFRPTHWQRLKAWLRGFRPAPQADSRDAILKDILTTLQRQEHSDTRRSIRSARA